MRLLKTVLYVIAFTVWCQAALHILSSIQCNSYKAISSITQQKLARLDGRATLQWGRAHCGIKGNEVADRAANLGHNNIMSAMSDLSFEELSLILEGNANQYWERSWRRNVILTDTGKFMFNLKPRICNTSWIKIKSRRLECSITRLRIGHAGVNKHLHRFEMKEAPLISVKWKKQSSTFCCIASDTESKETN